MTFRQIDSVRTLPGTDGVRCIKFSCGHERALSGSDYNKLLQNSLSPASARCVACEYEQGDGEVARG